MDLSEEIYTTLEKLNTMSQEMNTMLQNMIDKLNADSTPVSVQQSEKKPIMTKLSEKALDILKKCSIEGNIVRLPAGQLERKLYQEVAQRLNLIGGKWKGGKTMGFIFQEDPSELLAQIANGDKRNLKKEYQFFATPAPLADRLVELAEITHKHRILEPSAGQGAITDAIEKQQSSVWVDVCESMEVNQTILERHSNTRFICADFLNIPSQYLNYYDRIIANPPFAKNQDILHIRKMYDCLKKGGRLVSVASKHWQFASGKKETEFRNWLKEVNAEVQDIDAGEFKESGTTISTVIIIIDK